LIGRGETLLLEERSNPEDGDGTYDGSAELAQNATPRDADEREQPTAEHTTKQAEYFKKLRILGYAQLRY